MKMNRKIAVQRLEKCLALSESAGVSETVSRIARPWRGDRESEEARTWRRATRTVIAETFGQDSAHVQDFDGIFTRDHLSSAYLFPGGPLGKAKQLLASIIEEIRVYWDDQCALDPHVPRPVTDQPYVAPTRIRELACVQSSQFDFSKLIVLCEELNTCAERGCLYSTIFLTRCILDHVPPIFSCETFSEVANNYDGGKSFKELMLRLDNSSRKIADLHLHRQVRCKEPSINRVRITFSNELDALLQEVIHVITKQPQQGAGG